MGCRDRAADQRAADWPHGRRSLGGSLPKWRANRQCVGGSYVAGMECVVSHLCARWSRDCQRSERQNCSCM
ncbi:hypothetical protein ID866_8753 [Astraeus odoratus]|nr:hypothetical protein ID866_8753 [Astraeus odoratus]